LESQRVNEAIEAIQKPDMPFDMLNRWTRQAPLQAVAVAFRSAHHAPPIVACGPLNWRKFFDSWWDQITSTRPSVG
jgi:hypothetical protein